MASSDKTLLLVGGGLAIALVAYLLYTQAQANAANAASEEALENSLSGLGSIAPTGTALNDVLSGIGSIVSGSALSSLTDAFSGTTDSNDPGLEDDDDDDDNVPGLEDDDDDDFDD
jgi:hypothetical protein